MKDAFLLYEIEISDSKAQVRCLSAVIGTLLNCKNFSDEDYEALITKAAQYANKLLRKPDQSRMIVLCSHLFSHPYRIKALNTNVEGDIESTERTPYNDPDRVLECMQRALKVASMSNSNIFVEILDRCLSVLSVTSRHYSAQIMLCSLSDLYLHISSSCIQVCLFL